MKTTFRTSAILVAASVTAVVVSLAWAAAPAVFRHSGTIVEIDGGRMVLAEVGPWRLVDGQTMIDRLVIALPGEVELLAAVRAPAPPSGFPGDFVEMPVMASDLRVGDFVTVECVHLRGRLTATKVTVTEVLEP